MSRLAVGVGMSVSAGSLSRWIIRDAVATEK